VFIRVPKKGNSYTFQLSGWLFYPDMKPAEPPILSGALLKSSLLLIACLEAAHHFLLSGKKAAEIVAHQISAIGVNWRAVCDEAGLTDTDRTLLWGRQFLNPFGFEDLEGEYAELAKLAGDVRKQNELNF
jgi:hypothetical protein